MKRKYKPGDKRYVDFIGDGSVNADKLRWCKRCEQWIPPPYIHTCSSSFDTVKCLNCKEEKPIGEFWKTHKRKSGITTWCKNCNRIYSKKYYLKTKADKTAYRFGVKAAEYRKKWRDQNRSRIKIVNRKWRKDHPEEVRAIALKHDRAKRTTVRGRLRNRISGALWRVLRENKSNRPWESLVGYGVEDLKKHLESQFTDGMSWDNVGQWHIDHIMPESRFHYEKPEDPEFKVCWGLANLQPMWAKDNMQKQNMTPEEWRIKQNERKTQAPVHQ